MSLALTNGTLIDGTGADPIDRAVLTADGGRITAVGGKPSRDATVLDLTGLTVLPGLIDAHVHLGLSSDIEAAARKDVSAASMAAAMFATCKQTLEAGFTTVRDVGGVDGGIAGVVESGQIPGPRILPAGPLLCQSGGHGHFASAWEPLHHWQTRDIPGLLGMSILTDGVDEMRRNAREAFRRGATFLKLCVTGGVVSKHDKLTDTQFSVEEITAAVSEAKARGTYVTVHAHNNAGVRNAVTAGVACVEHGTFLDDETAAFMLEHGVALVPTLAVVHTLAERAGQIGLPPEVAERVKAVETRSAEAVRVALAAGLKIGSGSDLIGPDQSYRGLELVLKSEILGPMGALVSATKTNAEIIGLADTLGTLEAGKIADVIAIDGNPLEKPELFNEPSRVKLVIKNGIVVKDTL